MNAIDYQRAPDLASAVRANSLAGSAIIGGGTNLLDLMKGGVAQPVRLIDITRIAGLDQITTLPGGGLRIGATVRNSDLANHALVRERYPLLSQALLAGASAQLRNMATVGGNLMQRTRCHYFYDVVYAECNKRRPGSGCAAQQGFNRMHAIFGADARLDPNALAGSTAAAAAMNSQGDAGAAHSQCIAVQPSDMSVGLAALDATVRVTGPNGDRLIAMEHFHRLPGMTPERDNNLEPGEIITAVDLPASNFGSHVRYLKIRDRASYAFALVSVAAALDMDGNRVRSARIVLGGVAHKPWRAASVEQMLTGRTLDDATLAQAAASMVREAQPYPGNAFKVTLAQRAVIRAVREASQGVPA
ncbi:aldehyde dehydrogenase, FAD-binding subunit [Pararobbsia alpina]|uniref:FAD binding domain-containing protein n=1 Tax=Pararobbsia alpina TaxID=621374 RepID=UPI0039A56267